jgi:hypothetical protein
VSLRSRNSFSNACSMSKDAAEKSRATGRLEMIHFVRTVSIAPGKMADAMTFAKKIATYLAKKPGIKVEVSVPMAGNPNRIGWHSMHKDLGDFESVMNKLSGDAEYAKLVRGGAELIIPGSTNDALWRTI